MIVPRALSDEEKSLLTNLTVDEDKINAIESNTHDRAGCTEWKEECRYRFTASSFQVIAKRQRTHASFAQSIMHPKPFTSKYVAHGIKYEHIALQEYEKFMFNRKHLLQFLKVALLCPRASQYLVPPQMLKLFLLDVQCVLA